MNCEKWKVEDRAGLQILVMDEVCRPATFFEVWAAAEIERLRANEHWLNDLLRAAEAYRIQTIQAHGAMMVGETVNRLRDLETALNPMNYLARDNEQNLIQEIESARGPDRDLDGKIWLALGGMSPTYVAQWKSPPQYPLDEYLRMAAPRYTSSLDAALQTVPGWYWRAGSGSERPGWAHLNKYHPDHCDYKDEVTAYAATAELALCAAGLKARANGQSARPKEGS